MKAHFASACDLDHRFTVVLVGSMMNVTDSK